MYECRIGREIAELIATRQRHLEAVFGWIDESAGGLPLVEWARPSHSRTVRDLLCHLSWYYPEDAVPAEVQKVLRLAAVGRSIAQPVNLDELNLQRVRLLDGMPIRLVMERIALGRQALVRAVSTMEDAMLCAQVTDTRWGPKVTVAEIIRYSTYRHDDEHMGELALALVVAGNRKPTELRD